jgi:uncharacterized protein (TIGR03435 family)
VRHSAFVLALAVSVAQAQTAPTFEVASIKPNNSGTNSSGWHSRQGLMRLTNQSLRSLICIAYDIGDQQVAGVPKWADGERFDITAKAATPAEDPELRVMLRALLADRFQLKFHREPRQFAGYALVVAKGGMKMTKSSAEGSSTHGGRGTLEAKGASMAKLGENLTRRLNAPVTDATALKGGYDFKLEWDESSTPTGPSIFTALQEQLGLKLEARKVTLDAIVVDSATKPAVD